MEGLDFRRWRRFGHDRLYVTTGEGEQLGWWDAATDEFHPASADSEAALRRAIAGWSSRGDHRIEVPTTVSAGQHVAAVPALPAAAPAPAWDDLAVNCAGALVRQQAVAAREAEPVRTVLRRVLGVHSDERAWRVGADGEEAVGHRLERLTRRDPRWRALHSVPVGRRGSDIDHVVVGPAGVFTLNTKNHRGKKVWVGGDTVLVDGRRQAYVRNSRHEAARAGSLLSTTTGLDVHVRGILVLVGCDEVKIKEPPADVTVLTRWQLVRWLRKQRESLDTATLDVLYDAARRSTTWTG